MEAAQGLFSASQSPWRLPKNSLVSLRILDTKIRGAYIYPRIVEKLKVKPRIVVEGPAEAYQDYETSHLKLRQE